MRSAALLLLLAAPASASGGPEAARVAAEQAFQGLPGASAQAFRFKEGPRHFPKRRNPAPFWQDPKPLPLLPSLMPGPVVGRVALAGQLDKHRDLFVRTLGASEWAMSTASDAGAKTYFATFLQGERLVIAPLGDLNRLRGDGITVAIEPGLVYNFKVSINIFNPVRGSTLKITPAQGTRGPSHGVKTGAVLDAVKAKSYVFRNDGVEYWLLYGTDVDPATRALAKTRTLLFVHEAGLDSSAWPVAESDLPEDQPVLVTFGKQQLILVRAAGGELLIHKRP